MNADTNINITFREEFFGGIIFNNWGNLLYLDKKEVEDLKQLRTALEMPAKTNTKVFGLLDKLFENGIIVPSTNIKKVLSNIRMIDNRGDNREVLSAPLSVHFYPTYVCNQNCLFCYTPQKRRREKIDFDKTQKIVTRLMDQCHSAGVVIFNILGGEPLCYFDFLYNTLKEASNKFFCSFATNGSANGGVDSEKAKQLAQIPNLDIRVSIHSPCEEEHDWIVGEVGAYKKAIKSLQNLIDQGVRCRISYVPNKLSIDKYEELILKGNEMGVSGFHFLPPVSTDLFNTSDDMYYVEPTKLLREVEKLQTLKLKYPSLDITQLNWYFNLKYNLVPKAYPKQSPCVAGREIIEIDPDGDVYPCSMVLGNEEYSLGNIMTDTIFEIWRSPNLNVFRNLSISQVSNPKCMRCRYIEECKGGCPLENLRNSKGQYYGGTTCPWSTI